MDGIDEANEVVASHEIEITQEAVNLWNRDFVLLTIGQIISIFGNMIITFALPLYILYISNSPALFGVVLGLSNIPMLIMSPIGGIVADRFRKQRVMFWLDAVTTIIIVVYIALSGFIIAVVPVIIVKLMALNAIQGMYMPAVQASVPVLVPGGKIVTANAVVTLINSFSNMAGMAAAGILFANFGLMPILVVSAICFAITALMDLIIRIPFKKQDSTGGMIKIVKSDMLQAAKFMFREKPAIARCAVISFMFSLTLVSMIIVGIPVLITQHLNMTMEYVGISQSIMMAGGLAGGLLSGAIGNKLEITKAYLILIASGLAIIPIGLAFIFDVPIFTIYIIITAACALVFIIVMPVNILIISFIQTETPIELTGKVMSLLMVMPFLANALGQLFYGVVFEWFEAIPWLVVFVTVILTVLVGWYARKTFVKTNDI